MSSNCRSLLGFIFVLRSPRAPGLLQHHAPYCNALSSARDDGGYLGDSSWARLRLMGIFARSGRLRATASTAATSAAAVLADEKHGEEGEVGEVHAEPHGKVALLNAAASNRA